MPKVPKEVTVEKVTETVEFDDSINDKKLEVKKSTPKKSTKSKKPSCKTVMIRAVSKVATCLNDCWYSFEFSETREVSEGVNLDNERQDLWNTVHSQVDEQVLLTKDAIIGNTTIDTQNNNQIPPEYDY